MDAIKMSSRPALNGFSGQRLGQEQAHDGRDGLAVVFVGPGQLPDPALYRTGSPWTAAAFL